MLIELVAMDYHFVSDVIAGSVLGAIVGMYATVLSGVEARWPTICQILTIIAAASIRKVYSGLSPNIAINPNRGS